MRNSMVMAATDIAAYRSSSDLAMQSYSRAEDENEDQRQHGRNHDPRITPVNRSGFRPGYNRFSQVMLHKEKSAVGPRSSRQRRLKHQADTHRITQSGNRLQDQGGDIRHHSERAEPPLVADRNTEIPDQRGTDDQHRRIVGSHSNQNKPRSPQPVR